MHSIWSGPKFSVVWEWVKSESNTSSDRLVNWFSISTAVLLSNLENYGETELEFS